MKIGSNNAADPHFPENPDYYDGFFDAIDGASIVRGGRSAAYEAGFLAAHACEVFFGECFGMVGALQ